MNMAELIALASVRSGMTRGELAKLLQHKDQSRISKLAAGALEPKATEIVTLAEKAQLDPVKTLGQIESEMHPEFADVWERVTGQESVREL